MIQNLYIKITDNCNLSCPFCYVKKQQNIIDPNIAIDYIKNKDPRNIIFHGGEPLLYPSIINKIIDESGDKNYSITTNFMLPITKERERVLNRCKIATSYSIDRFKNNSFNIFLENAKRFEFTLLVTLSNLQLNQPINELIGIINIINPNNITFERVYGSKNLNEKTDNYLLELFQLFDDKRNNLLQMMIDSIEKNIPVFPKNCNKDTIILNVDGSISNCPNLYLNKNNKYIKRKECLECDIFPFCKGDCLSFQNSCNFPKKTFKYVLSKWQSKKMM